MPTTMPTTMPTPDKLSSTLTLTRHLYARDEVEASLLTALLKKDDLCESYFWGYELHYSGFDLFAVLWRIYYDVYFELNPRLETYLSRKQETWAKKRDVGVFACCIKNMHLSVPTSTVFVLRQHATRASGMVARAHAYRGRPPKWCANHNKKYHSWLRAISNKDYPNIACHTYCLARERPEAANDMFVVLLAYFADTFEVVPEAGRYWKARKYSDDAHYLLSIIVHLIGDMSLVSDYHPTKVARQSHLKMFRDFGSDVVEGCPPYRMLKERRLYGIAPTIGGFVLARHGQDVGALGEIYQVNSVWERFAFETPYWVDRFATYGATYDTVRTRVCFPTDDAREDFYDRYGLEPDEQSCAVRDRSLGPIESDGWRSWYDFVFGDSGTTIVVDFEDTFRFTI